MQTFYINIFLILIFLIPFFVLLLYGDDLKPFLFFHFLFVFMFVFVFFEFLGNDLLLFSLTSLILILILLIIPSVHSEILVILLSLFFFSYCLLNCNSLISLYILLECITICVFILIHYCRNDLIGVESALKYMVVNLFSSSLLLVGILLLYFQWGVFDINQIIVLKNYQINFLLMDTCGSIFIFLSLLIKLSVFPFHNWMLEVFKGLEQASLLVISNFSKMILFIISYYLFPIFEQWSFILLVCSLLSLAYGSLLLLFETNSRMFIGQLSLISSGYSLLFIYCQEELPLLFYLFSQSINFIFLICFIDKVVNLKDQLNLLSYKPYVFISYFLIIVSFIGVPPLITFLPKLFLFNLFLNKFFLLLFLILISLLNGIALLRVFIYCLLPDKSTISFSSDHLKYIDLISLIFLFVQLIFIILSYTTIFYV